MTTSFNPAAPADPAIVAPVTPTPAPAAPTGFDFEYGGKKFTREELLTKLTHADTHIQTLVAERTRDAEALAAAAAKLEAAKRIEDLLKAQPTPAAPAAPSPAPAPLDIESAVAKVVEARDIKAREESNWKAAQEAVTKAYGDKADQKVKETAAALGMSFDGMVQLARTAPAAFARLFPELSASPTPASPAKPAGGVNTQAIKALPTVGKTGFWDASNSKDQTAIYLKRLNELTGA